MRKLICMIFGHHPCGIQSWQRPDKERQYLCHRCGYYIEFIDKKGWVKFKRKTKS